MAEFIPLNAVLSLSETRLPHDDTFLNGIIYMVYLQQAVACLCIFLLGVVLTLDMIFISSKRYFRNDGFWLRDPLEILDPRKRNSAETIVVRFGNDFARVWSVTTILLIMIAVEWDILHYCQHSPQDRIVRDASADSTPIGP
ncbi:hypothetical protein CVT25_007306 [Psilocybe cyanescens]|uniref:Uncharacterized protein n=1 Tax=Psilocybe cyanescens TaxID=93625 RepID=A0A409XPG4_PSICY|nr:hypothetical protein CVT25_007306 [Psilocybe cyanescens]